MQGVGKLILDRADGQTLMISIQMGIYDSSYLNTYQSNPALRSKYLNRIAVFIIPYDGAATAPHQIHANIAPPPLPPGGGTGYELSGSYPLSVLCTLPGLCIFNLPAS